jgi:hypothetical protein
MLPYVGGYDADGTWAPTKQRRFYWYREHFHLQDPSAGTLQLWAVAMLYGLHLTAELVLDWNYQVRKEKHYGLQSRERPVAGADTSVYPAIKKY